MKLPTNIWDLAIQQSKEKRADVLARNDSQSSSQERSLLILGSRGVGKTTLIHRFLDSQDSAKPTLALEYTFGRKTNNNLAKVLFFLNAESSLKTVILGCLSYLGTWWRHFIY